MTPTFSIIVPTYNQDMYLPAALDSILAQTYPHWESVVVNDGSTDRTRDILDTYATRDSRIRVIHKANGGVASALNRGLAEARGEWINWLSSDDLFEPSKLECNLRHIMENPDADFFYSYFRLLRERTGQIEEHDLWGPLPAANHEIIGLFFRNYINGITICVRRTLWNQIGYFDKDLRFGQDYDMWLRLLQKAKPKFISEPTVISRNHDEQGSEIFPAACYYDSARAALRVLNKSDLCALVPFVDVSDVDELSSLMRSIMAVAADPTAFVYRLGNTPLLAARLAEVLWAPDAPPGAQSLRKRFLTEAGRLALHHQHDDFGLMWAVLRATFANAAQVTDPLVIDPSELALSTYARRAASSHPESGDLERYLTSFLQVAAPVVSRSRPSGRVLLLGNSDQTVLMRCAADLIRDGVLTVRSGSRLGQDRLGYTVPLDGHVDLSETLPLLGCFDVAASRNASDLPWVFGTQRLVLDGPTDEWADRVRKRLPLATDRGTSTEHGKASVLILGLSPWGGGAERVMAELYSGIDREKFSVEIACLYRSQEDGDYPRGSIIHFLCDGSDKSYASRQSLAGVNPSPIATGPPVGRLDRLILTMPPGLRAVLKKAGGRRVLSHVKRAVQLTRRSIHGVRRAGRLGRRAASYLALRGRLYLRSLVSSEDPAAYIAEIWRFRFQAVISRLTAKLARSEPAAVITFMEHGALLTRLAMPTGGPCHMISLHTRESEYLPLLFPDQKERAFVESTLRSAVMADGRAYLPSRGCVQDLERLLSLPQGVVGVLPNPTNISRIRFLASFEPEAGDLGHWLAGRKHFVSLARLDPEKNHALLIAAVECLSDREDIAVICIGDGNLREDLEVDVQRRGLDDRIRFIGTMANPFPLLKRAHGLLLTSRFEAFGLVLVEAMALDVPTIAVDCPFGPREVLAAGRFGILVPPDDAEGFAAAIRSLADDDELRDRLIRSGRERALEYDVTRVLPLWESAILNCVTRARTCSDRFLACTPAAEAT